MRHLLYCVRLCSCVCKAKGNKCCFGTILSIRNATSQSKTKTQNMPLVVVIHHQQTQKKTRMKQPTRKAT